MSNKGYYPESTVNFHDNVVSKQRSTGIRYMLKFIKVSLLVLTLIGATIWAVLAVYFGDSHYSVVRASVAAVFSLFGLVTLVSLGFARWRKRLLVAYSILFVAILSWWLFAINPSNERQWQPDVAKLAYATFDGDTVTVHNIRNFDYRGEFDFQPAYLNGIQYVTIFALS